MEDAMSQKAAVQQPVQTLDPVWDRIRMEAEEAARNDPSLGGFLFAAVLNHDSFESALCHRLGQRP
jgi:serine O-acetyltransferase